MTRLGMTLAACVLAGSAVFGTGAASAHGGGASFYMGPGGSHITYQQGYYRDRQRHRHAYRYPSDWQSYGYEQSWYQTHNNWYQPQHRNWYRSHGRRHR